VITISGALAEALILPVSALTKLPRHQMAADFHCVAGWTATDLHWEGVAFADLYHLVIEPTLPAGTSITHVVFGGLDGFRSIVTIEDALAPDVLLAEHLNGDSLTSDHGAPIRLVSPRQYGFVSTKHLCEIVLHTTRPREIYHPRRHTPAQPATAQAPPAGKSLARGTSPLPPRSGGATRLPNTHPVPPTAQRPRRPARLASGQPPR
jgi:DMSO/TMAO reductase YedYZ molybdopterin-dependent catalytic subunit